MKEQKSKILLIVLLSITCVLFIAGSATVLYACWGKDRAEKHNSSITDVDDDGAIWTPNY